MGWLQGKAIIRLWPHDKLNMDEKKNRRSLGVNKYIGYEDGGKYWSDHEKVAEWGELRGRKWEWGGGWMGDLGLVANTRRHSLEGQLRPLVLPALCSGLVVLPSFIEEHRWAIGATLIVSVAAGALIYNWICVSRIFSGKYDHCCVLSVVFTTFNFTKYML